MEEQANYGSKVIKTESSGNPISFDLIKDGKPIFTGSINMNESVDDLKKSEAIAFAEWIRHKIIDDKLIVHNNIYHLDLVIYDDIQLYNKFKEETSSK